MSIYLNVRSPAAGQAGQAASVFGLENHGLTNLRTVYWNLSTAALYEEATFRGEATIAHSGPLVVNTGKHAARAVSDKFVVREETSEDRIWWGQYNRPISQEAFSALLARLQGYLQGRDVFVQDCFAGADPEHRMPVRIITELAWHSLFARTMFERPRLLDEYRNHVPDFTVIAVPGFEAAPLVDGTPTGTFIILNLGARVAIIGGSAYAGEIKKTVFTAMNFLLPLEGVLSLHAAANVGGSGHGAVFLGLSGTGKTTLSADPARNLIGDDELGWSANGVFNIEAGCYAKVIRLSPEAEPQIYACTQRFGTVLENVVLDPHSRRIDLDDDTLTENTRGAYPIDFIDNAVPSRTAGHPKHVVFLTCDATGVLPPIARLSPDQAVYHFMSGYTSKIAGTEVGLGIEPEITFSPCFGAPFMVLHPYEYARMLAERVVRHGVQCWLLNTGWTGGRFGVGKRISIRHTRALLHAALDGRLDDVVYRIDSVFGFEVPETCEGVPEEILDPASTWANREEYFSAYDALAARFDANFQLLSGVCPSEVAAAGPRWGGDRRAG